MKQATFFKCILLSALLYDQNLTRQTNGGRIAANIHPTVYDIIDIKWILDSFSALRLGRPAYFAQLKQEVSCYSHCSILQRFQIFYCVRCGNYNIDSSSIVLESFEYFVGRDRQWRFCCWRLCCYNSGSILLRRRFFTNTRRTTNVLLCRWSRIQWKKWRLVPWVATTSSRLFLSKVKL